MREKTAGERISDKRNALGLSRRKLASKFGTSTRRIIAMETDTDVKPRKEKRMYYSKFIPFLGYSVRCYTDWPIRDTSFDLHQQQSCMLNFLRENED